MIRRLYPSRPQGRTAHRGADTLCIEVGSDAHERLTVHGHVMSADAAMDAVGTEISAGLDEEALLRAAGLDPMDTVLLFAMLYVTPDRAGRGWGRRFAQAVERWARREGAVGILGDSVEFAGRRHSLGFWHRQGYTTLWRGEPLLGEHRAVIWKSLR